MFGKLLALLAAISLVSGIWPAQAGDAPRLLTSVNNAQSNPTPPGMGSAVKKKKGKKKGDQQQYMTIKMENVYVSGRTVPQRPNTALGGGLLGNSTGGFNQNPPSATGTPLAPPPGGAGGGGPVIK
jgi:hypothetical protein